MKTVLLKTTTDKINNYQGIVFLPVMDDCENVPYGEVMAEIRKKRNPGNHKRFMAFIRRTFDMQDDFDNITTWRKYIQMKAGHYELVVTPKGEPMYWPKSVNWDEMDETEFRPLFTEVVNAFIKYYGQNLNEIELNSILEF